MQYHVDRKTLVISNQIFDDEFSETKISLYLLVRLTLPGYNNFSRSLSVITPGVEFDRGVIFVVLEEGTGTDAFGGLDGMIAFGSRSDVRSAVDNASS